MPKKSNLDEVNKEKQHWRLFRGLTIIIIVKVLTKTFSVFES